MNRELLAKAFGDIDNGIVAEAYRPVTEAASGSPERIVHMNKKRIVTFALAAALMLALGKLKTVLNSALEHTFEKSFELFLT